ncbi:hypothetical protein [Siminovitchia sp. 179-K 8D1 HS]|uniref:hypothetical protein n=1 Tax=Siminovitchia sp. 179-K 8D1 HS TaxID=3142385 RepID=UPI0039A0C899
MGHPSKVDIFTFMVNKYNGLTNYGTNYIPVIHDPEIARLASDKFGIVATDADRTFIKKEMKN